MRCIGIYDIYMYIKKKKKTPRKSVIAFNKNNENTNEIKIIVMNLFVNLEYKLNVTLN